MKTKSQIGFGSILSFGQIFLNIIIGLIYIPLMIKLLGQSEYGLYNTVASTISMLTILNLGFGSGYIRYYSRYKAVNDTKSIDKLNGLFLIIFLIIGAVAFGCGTFLVFNLDMVFENGLTAVELELARVLMSLLTVNLTISFPMSVFSSIISAHERFIFLKLLGMAKTVFNPLLTIPLLMLGYGSVAVVTVTLIVSLIVDVAYLFYVFRVLKCRFVFCGFEKGIFKDLFSYTLFIALNVIVDQVNWNVDKVLLGRFKGTVCVAIYSVGATLQSYYQMFSSAISGVFTPYIHRVINNKDLESSEKIGKLNELFVNIGKIQFALLAMIVSGFVLFGKSFILHWAGEGYDESYYVAILLMIPVTIPLIQNIGIEIQRALNKHQFRSIAYTGMVFFNLAVTVYLAPRYGAIGAAMGTALSLVIANGFIMNIYYHKACNINILHFWKSIARLSLGLIIPIIYGVVLNRFIEISGFFVLVLVLLSYMVVYLLSMWTVGINLRDRKLFMDLINKVLGKK